MNIYSKEALAKTREKVPFPKGLNLREHVRETAKQKDGHRIYEFIGADTFGSEWNERRRYEVDAGRDEEPILYTPIYNEIRDSSLPELINIYKIGPGGVVFEEVKDGGEVKFASVTSSEESVRIRHYGQGLEYSKDLVVYNQLWRVPIVERQMGIAYNALLNHIHMNPILSYSYAAANQTAANTAGASYVEDIYLTFEDAITNSKTDTTNPRRGPYVVLCSSANLFAIEKALKAEVQQGFAVQASSARDMIRAIVAYDGWTGTRGDKTTTYAGVTSGKAYLISLQYQMEDFQSYMKQDLMQDGEDMDASRFMTQLIYDTYFGAYANPLRSVEEVTLPTP